MATFVAVPSFAQNAWVVYEGRRGPGLGKHIVLISGDEEYRSEEALTQLGRILARRHGFRCTVLFAVDPKTGTINPNVTTNIPGLEALDSADLMLIFTRFRALPDEQMRHIDDFLKSGKPVLGIRTATHAFMFPGDNSWAHYGNGYGGEKKEWTDGFGRLVLGEKWINHHGSHRHESTRGIIAPDATNHPISRGINDGDIWGPTDVYGVRLPLPGDSKPVILGQVVARKGQYDAADLYYGMRPDDGPPVEAKNNPMMPIAWTKTYQAPGGKQGRAFASTIGAATDLVSEGTRRLLINGVYWCMGMEDQIPQEGTNVELIGRYEPTAYGSHTNEYWLEKGVKPADLQMRRRSGRRPTN
ncbi:MAG: ThuA domain-containing protein [Sedimentisphaerales bacterium]|nr:ThuA domain-containing protein [Sedimentisphaerales bacterium]